MKLLNILLIAAIIVGIAVAVSFYHDPKSWERDEQTERLQRQVSALEREVSALKKDAEAKHESRKSVIPPSRKPVRKDSVPAADRDLIADSMAKAARKIPFPKMSPERALEIFNKALPSLDTGEKLEAWVEKEKAVFYKLSTCAQALIRGISLQNANCYIERGDTVYFIRLCDGSVEFRGSKTDMFKRYAEYHKRGWIRRVENLEDVIYDRAGNKKVSRESSLKVKSLSQEEAVAAFEKTLPVLDTGEKLDVWVRSNTRIINALSLEYRKLIYGVIFAYYDEAGKEHVYPSSIKEVMFTRYEKAHREGRIRSIEDLSIVRDKKNV